LRLGQIVKFSHRICSFGRELRTSLSHRRPSD
jgi:hypothetical protein